MKEEERDSAKSIYIRQEKGIRKTYEIEFCKKKKGVHKTSLLFVGCDLFYYLAFYSFFLFGFRCFSSYFYFMPLLQRRLGKLSSSLVLESEALFRVFYARDGHLKGSRGVKGSGPVSLLKKSGSQRLAPLLKVLLLSSRRSNPSKRKKEKKKK